MKPIAKLFQQAPTNIMAQIGKTAALMTDVVDLSIGDPDLDTPPALLKATKQALDDGKTHYTASNGDPAYLTSILEMHRRKFGQHYGMENIWATAGATHSLYLTLGALLDPGDEVIIPSPYFSPYKVQVEAWHAKPVFVNCTMDHDFQPQSEDLEQAITASTKAIVVNSPNNPTGAVYNQSTLDSIVSIARKHDLYIISDQVYWPYAFGDNTYIPLENLAPERTIVLGSLSKVFAMTGFRCGYVLGPEPVITAVGLLNEGVCYTAPSMAQCAGGYGMDHIDEIIPPLQHTFEERLTYLSEQLAQIPWISLMPSLGSIYLFANISGSGLDDIAFSDTLLEQQGVLVIPGQAFGEAGRGFVRLAATQPLSSLEQAVNGFASLNL